MTSNISLIPNPTLGSAAMKDGSVLVLDGLLVQDCRLFFPKLPTVNFFLQKVVLPDIRVNEVKQRTRFVDPNEIGEKVNYEPFTVNFMVDKYMKNWNEIFDWMKKMTVQGSNVGMVDDAILIVGGKHTVKFVGSWPMALTRIEYDATLPQAEYVYCGLTINYDYIDYVGQFATVDSSYTSSPLHKSS